MDTNNNEFEQDSSSASSFERRMKMMNMAATIALLATKMNGQQNDSSEQRPKESGRNRNKRK